MLFKLFERFTTSPTNPVSTVRSTAESTIASLSVLLTNENNKTVVSVYDNKNILSERIVQITLVPNQKDYAKELGEAIIKAANTPQ
ncbi:MAG: hypothetical protein ACOVLB_08540 [Candidatus Nanopelagicus sp.]